MWQTVRDDDNSTYSAVTEAPGMHGVVVVVRDDQVGSLTRTVRPKNATPGLVRTCNLPHLPNHHCSLSPSFAATEFPEKYRPIPRLSSTKTLLTYASRVRKPSEF